MESDAVIEDLDIVEDGGAGLGEGGEAVMIDQFVFEATKEPFDKGVVVAVAKFSKCIASTARGDPFLIFSVDNRSQS